MISSRPNAVVLLSGGLDSTVTAAIAQHDGYRIHCMTVSYGQRHHVEVERARAVAERLEAAGHVVVTVDLRAIGGSALTADVEVPKDRTQEERAGNIPVTYVPARNTIFLSLALAYAETVSASAIYFGANVLDYSGYPDCRPEYVAAYQAMARLATRAGVEGKGMTIHAPIIQLSKAEIIREGTRLGVDYGITVSCYRADPQGRACGTCDSCRLRFEGFAAAGVADVTRYAA